MHLSMSSAFGPPREHIFVELWTTSHLSSSFFLGLSVRSYNLFKHHGIIPAFGVNFFLNEAAIYFSH